MSKPTIKSLLRNMVKIGQYGSMGPCACYHVRYGASPPKRPISIDKYPTCQDLNDHTIYFHCTKFLKTKYASKQNPVNYLNCRQETLSYNYIKKKKKNLCIMFDALISLVCFLVQINFHVPCFFLRQKLQEDLGNICRIYGRTISKLYDTTVAVFRYLPS